MAQTMKMNALFMKIKTLITGEQTSIIMQLVKHLAIGGVGKVINLAGYPLLIYLSINLAISNAIVNVFAIIATFLLQKYFNFRVAINTRMQLVKFLINSIAYYCVDTLILALFQEQLHFTPFTAKLISTVILVAPSFLSMKFWVFRKNEPDQPNEKNAGK